MCIGWQVNAVTKKSTKELLAIKRVTKTEVLKKDPDLYTIRIEHAIMTRVQSPFCLNVIHVFETETELCFVMPFMRGTHPIFSVIKCVQSRLPKRPSPNWF